MNIGKNQKSKKDSPLRAQALRNFPFLSMLNDKDLHSLMKEMDVLYVNAHEVIINEDRQQEDPPLYLIYKGECQVSKLGLYISTLKKNDHFGEMSLLTHKPRSTTIKAIKSCILFVMKERTFNKFLRGKGDVINQMALTLDNRLRQTNESISKRFFDKDNFENANQNILMKEFSLELANKVLKASSLSEAKKTSLLFRKYFKNLEKTKENTSIEPFSVHDLIHNSCKLLDNKLIEEKISFNLILLAKNTEISGHYEKIQQIFLILLSNAKKSILTKKMALKKRSIKIQTKNLKDKIHIEIQDQGHFNALSSPSSLLRWPIDSVMKEHKGQFKAQGNNRNILIFKCN